MKLPAFYKKYLAADGYPIVASEKVNEMREKAQAPSDATNKGAAATPKDPAR